MFRRVPWLVLVALALCGRLALAGPPTLQWEWTGTDPDTFQILRCAATPGVRTCLPTADLAGASVAGSVRTYDDTTRVAGTDYCYRVVSIVAGVRSASGNSTCTNVDVVSNLTLSYTLNAGTGTTATDQTVNANHGTLLNGATWAAGKFGQGVTMTGTNQQLRTPASTSLNNMAPWSYSAWVFVRSIPSGWPRLYDKGSNTLSGLTIALNAVVPGELSIETYSTGGGFVNQYFDLGVWPMGAWHHLAATWPGTLTGADFAVYLDGVLLVPISTSNGSGAVVNDSSHPLILGNSEANTQGSDMVIDEVRIWQRALTDGDINAVYWLDPTVAPPPTIAAPTQFRVRAK